MPCELGCSQDARVFLRDRCSRQTICELTDSVTFLKWGRELDDDSEAEVSLHFGSDASGQMCCACMANARTWRHEIHIERDGEPVWQGPIVNLSYQKHITRVVARDIIAWLDVRVIRNAYSFVGVDLTTIAETVIEDAISAHDDVCILEFVQASPAGQQMDMNILERQRTAGEVLRELAEAGLDFTVVGRSLVLGGEFAFGPVGPLVDEHFLGNVEVEERGLSAATKYYLPGSGVVGECGGVDPYYGLIERAVETFHDRTDVAILNAAACERVSSTNPPPLFVSAGSDSFLAPTAPVCPALLVPGTMVELDIRDLCRPAHTLQRLTSVSFRYEDGEQVRIAVAPTGENFEPAGEEE